MIETDGISCSIVLLRRDKTGKKIKSKKVKGREKYIDELEDYSMLEDKKIVGIDPGKCDLIYCTDGDDKTSNTYRYSQDRRRKETKTKKYGKLLLKFNKIIINISTNMYCKNISTIFDMFNTSKFFKIIITSTVN